MGRKRALQWHPAFFAALKAMEEKEQCSLQIQREYNLGTKPRQIDVLITKNDQKNEMQNSIGRIFRKHNIVEYKGPSDKLNCNDFYKVCGYACFFIGDARRVLEIDPAEVTITFVCSSYPVKLVRHLAKQYGIRVKKEDAGIYYLEGSRFPIQIIVSRRLNPEKYLWLYVLRGDLDAGELKMVLRDYEKHRDSADYQSMMDIIIRANRERMKEEEMCEALKELYEEIYAEKLEEEFAAREKLGEKRGEKRGERRGERRGIRRGETIMGNLVSVLLESGRTEDLQRAAEDQVYRRKLMKELGIPERLTGK